jgi:hypothetical protein
VATAGLSPGDIAQPIRHILSGCRNVQVILDEATQGFHNHVLVSKPRRARLPVVIYGVCGRYSRTFARRARGLKGLAT